MQLKKLSLKNVRSYTDIVIDFPKGSLLLAGDIGSGKSTILKAIEFALFGSQKGVLDASEILRKGCKNAEIRLDFSSGEDNYIIFRTIKNGLQGAGYLIINDVKEELMPTELRARMLDILGYPNADVYRYTVYSSQEQMKAIILEKPEDRLDTLRLIFGVDKYKKVIGNAEIITKSLRAECNYLDGQVADLPSKEQKLGEVFSEFNNSKLKVEDLGKKLVVVKEELAVVEKDSDSIALKIKELDLKKQKLTFFEKDLLNGQNDILLFSKRKELLGKEIADFELQFKSIVIQEGSNLSEVLTKVLDLRRFIDANKLLISSLKEKKLFYETQISGLVVVGDNYDLKKKHVLEKMSFIEKDISELSACEALLKEKESSIAKISALISNNKNQGESVLKIDVCPVCFQKVDESHKTHLLSELDGKNNLLNDNFKSISVEIKELKEKTLLLEKKKQERIQFDIEIAKLLALSEEDAKKKISLDKFRVDLGAVEVKLFALSKIDFAEQEKILKELEFEEKKLRENEILKQKKKGLVELIGSKNKSVVELDKSMMELTEKLKLISSQIELLKLELINSSHLLQDFTVIDSKLKNIRIVFQNANALFESAKKENSMLEKSYTDLLKEVDFKKEILKKSEWNKQMRVWLTSFFVPLMESIERKILLEIYYEFNRNFSEWFNVLIEDDSFNVSIDNSFSPIVRQNDYDIDISSLSGGERTSVALAYRLALNRIVNELLHDIKTRDLLILDEPTEGFSSEQLDKVRDVLHMLNVPQLVIVSHEQKIEAFVSNILRIEKIGNVSSISSG